MRHLRFARFVFSALLLALVAATPATQPVAKPEYIAPGAINLKATLPNPPANDSDETRAELVKMLALQDSRTQEQIDRANKEVKLTDRDFADVIGKSFDFSRHPAADHLISQVIIDTETVALDAKKFWSRPRPYELEPKLNPVVPRPTNKSYPSGHATRAYAMAVVLADLFPEKKVAFFARAARIGEDRVIAGVHYPSDIAAGKKLGELIGRKILTSLAFKADEAKAKLELASEK